MKRNFTVRQNALDGIEAFLSVARHRNFRRASAELGVTPSAVGQVVRGLEARLGAALFIRTTRTVGLTEVGERFLARAAPAYEQLVAAGAAARDLGQRPAGLLRLSVPRGVLPLMLGPVFATFCAAYPEIELEIAASEESVDIAAKGFDAGIRLGQFLEGDMVAVRLSAPFRFVAVGSPDYLGRHGAPTQPDDLRSHACLRLRRSGGALAHWSFVVEGRPLDVAVTGPMIANDYPALTAAAAAGVGLAQTPEPVATAAIAEGRLVVVLERFAPTLPGIFLYHPGRRQELPKLRAFIEHAKARMPHRTGAAGP